MPPASQISHRNVQETNLAYVSNASPTSSDPRFTSLSRDILTSIKGYFERRPGFSASLEASATTFTAGARIFEWNRFDGTFIYIVNDITGGNSVVYKMISGTDANFVSILTDAGNTTPFDFVVSNNTLYMANGHVTKKWDPTNGLSNWSITAPAAAPTIGSNAGTALNLQVGWRYVYCYGRLATGSISSPSAISASTGTETVASVTVTVVASGDAQVDQIRVFRTTDGGGGNYFEIAGSPFANSSTTLTDTTADAALSTVTAPTPTFNDPPPAWQGMVYWHGRIWGFVNNKVWFTGLEELTIGVPEECVPSGQGGNFWAFDQQVLGLASLPGTLVVFCPGRVYSITGDTLDTLRRTLLSNRRGCRRRETIATLGNFCTWYDTSGQMWGTDGSTLTEVGQDIRPDLTGLTLSNLSSTFHVSGATHWLAFSTNSLLFVLDLDTEQWMPPWTVALSYIFSAELSAGSYALLGFLGQKVFKLSTSAFNDNGATYQWKAYTNLFNIVPDFGKRFSYIGQGTYDQPSRLGTPWMVGLERNSSSLSAVKVVVDDDPQNSATAYIDITQQQVTPEQSLLRTQGQNLIQDVFEVIKPAGRRMGLQLVGQNKDQADNVYSFFIGYGERR